VGLSRHASQDYNGLSTAVVHDRTRRLSRESELLYLLACRAQWRCTGDAEAFRELLQARASADPVTRCVARTLLQLTYWS
jgi:hypothetical protein